VKPFETGASRCQNRIWPFASFNGRGRWKTQSRRSGPQPEKTPRGNVWAALVTVSRKNHRFPPRFVRQTILWNRLMGAWYPPPTCQVNWGRAKGPAIRVCCSGWPAELVAKTITTCVMSCSLMMTSETYSEKHWKPESRASAESMIFLTLPIQAIGPQSRLSTPWFHGNRSVNMEYRRVDVQSRNGAQPVSKRATPGNPALPWMFAGLNTNVTRPTLSVSTCSPNSDCPGAFWGGPETRGSNRLQVVKRRSQFAGKPEFLANAHCRCPLHVAARSEYTRNSWRWMRKEPKRFNWIRFSYDSLHAYPTALGNDPTINFLSAGVRGSNQRQLPKADPSAASTRCEARASKIPPGRDALGFPRKRNHYTTMNWQDWGAPGPCR